MAEPPTPTDRTETQPWMQLAELLKVKGDNAGAKRVIFDDATE
jgi:hypothetical protein